MIVLKFHVILLIICNYRASIVESRNAKNRAQGGPVREPIKTGKDLVFRFLRNHFKPCLSLKYVKSLLLKYII